MKNSGFGLRMQESTAKKVLVLKNERCEDLGVFEKSFEELGIAWDYFEANESFPDSVDSYDAIVILGGPQSVYESDKFSFLKREVEIIRESFHKNKAILGICLGAQLIAYAFGARVYKGREKEIGWYEITLTEKGKNDFIFSHFPQSFTAFHWHGDSFELPENAELLANSQKYKQAFRIGNKCYALQFHLEITKEMVESWLNEYSREVEEEVSKGKISRKKILEEAELYADSLNILAEKFIKRFKELFA